MTQKQQHLEDLIIRRIRDFPYAKFADIFDADVKEACAKASPTVAHSNLFRVADRVLQSLRKEGRIKYQRGGWHLVGG